MSKISDLNYSQHITLADNFKQKSEVLNTWRVGMNNFASSCSPAAIPARSAGLCRSTEVMMVLIQFLF